eukprot:SM000082S22845  [mRNA]  locus=s82:207062:207713:- [translate_table: standard]
MPPRSSASPSGCSQVAEEDRDLALSAYARLGRALALYEVGDRGEAILELQDLTLELKGYPEAHAALAAGLYQEKRNSAPQAERQFTIATLLDRRYADPVWVATDRHWPPSLVAALRAFLTLD